jgi:hypothetical protein
VCPKCAASTPDTPSIPPACGRTPSIIAVASHGQPLVTSGGSQMRPGRTPRPYTLNNARARTRLDAAVGLGYSALFLDSKLQSLILKLSTTIPRLSRQCLQPHPTDCVLVHSFLKISRISYARKIHLTSQLSSYLVFCHRKLNSGPLLYLLLAPRAEFRRMINHCSGKFYSIISPPLAWQLLAVPYHLTVGFSLVTR